MPRKRIIDYDWLYAMYDIKPSRDIANNIERRIKDMFHKHHKDDQWEKLSQSKKDTFVCETIQPTMFKNYITDEKQQTRVLKKINAYLANNLINERRYAESLQQELKQHETEKYEEFYNQEKFDSIENTDEKEKAIEEAYKNFVRVCNFNFPNLPVPELNEWIERNKVHPINVMGYFTSYINQAAPAPQTIQTIAEADDTEINEKIQKEIDHIILMTVVKVLREKNIADIDIDKITSCCQSLFEMSDIDDRYPIYEYNPLLGVSQEVKDEYIEAFRNLHFKNSKELQDEYIKMFRKLKLDISRDVKLEYYQAFRRLNSQDTAETQEEYLQALKKLGFEASTEAQAEYVEEFQKLHFKVGKDEQDKYIQAFQKFIYAGVSRETQEAYIEDFRKLAECSRQIKNLDFIKTM